MRRNDELFPRGIFFLITICSRAALQEEHIYMHSDRHTCIETVMHIPAKKMHANRICICMHAYPLIRSLCPTVGIHTPTHIHLCLRTACIHAYLFAYMHAYMYMHIHTSYADGPVSERDTHNRCAVFRRKKNAQEREEGFVLQGVRISLGQT
jgi:hypothetical protein